MKGKRLYHLLNDLNKSQLQQLHFRCTMGEDKRSKVLKELIESDYKEISTYQNSIEQLGSHFKNLPDTQKALRRFIDFACKEIENLSIYNYLQENKGSRDFILTNVYSFNSSSYLFHYYHGKAQKSSSEEGAFWREKIVLTNQKLQWYSKGQTRQDYQKIKELILQKNQLNHEGYYSELVVHYSTLSGIYLEDNTEIKFFQDFIPSEEDFQLIIDQSPKPYYTAQLYLSKARFVFRDKEKLYSNIVLSESILTQMDSSSLAYHRLNRSLNYLQVLGGMNYGAPLEEVLNNSRIVFNVNQRYEYKDSVSFFMHQMLLMLANEWQEMRMKRRKFAEFYFDESNEMYPQFLEGLEYFLEGQEEKALLILNALSYSSSHYVALWSKLIVLKIHADLGSQHLMKKLIDRANRYLKNNAGKCFTQEVSSQLILGFKRNLNLEFLSINTELFHFFKLLIPKT